MSKLSDLSFRDGVSLVRYLTPPEIIVSGKEEGPGEAGRPSHL